MTADSKFFGPAPDMVGQAGGARFDAKRVSDQVWILEIRPLVDQPGAKVTGDQVVAVMQWIASNILGINPATMTPEDAETFKGWMDKPLPKPERHLQAIPSTLVAMRCKVLSWRCPICGYYYEQQGKCPYLPCSNVLLLPQELMTAIPPGIYYRHSITPETPDGGDAA